MQAGAPHSFSLFDTQAYVDALNSDIERLSQSYVDLAARREVLQSLLLRSSVQAACDSVQNREGGPFGAILADLRIKPAGGLARVVGFGTNHVVTTNDPSAHAEIIALRDAAMRLGISDMSGLTLITSCECCPMCLAAAASCKVAHVHFSAGRSDAAQAGFSDEKQYQLMMRGGIEQHAQRFTDTVLAEVWLEGHDAVIIVRGQGAAMRYFGDYSASDMDDPTDIPVVQAIRRACAAQGVFHLPEDTLLVSRQMPHPLSLITADWARIGRRRGQDAQDPSWDSQEKDTSRILYLRDQFETLSIRDANGPAPAVAPERVWEEIRRPTALRLTHGKNDISPFTLWNQLVQSQDMPRY